MLIKLFYLKLVLPAFKYRLHPIGGELQILSFSSFFFLRFSKANTFKFVLVSLKAIDGLVNDSYDISLFMKILF